MPLERIAVQIHGESDRAKQTRTDVSTLNFVKLDFQLWGVNDAQAGSLVEGFKRR